MHAHPIASSYSKGFTIVELLIVIVVIAILAAISVVAYTGIQERAHNSAVQTDLRNAGARIAMYHATEGRYPGDTNQFTGDYAMSFTHDAYDTTAPALNVLYCRPSSNDGSAYALLATARSGNQYYISSSTGVSEYTGSNNWRAGVASGICSSVESNFTNGGLTGWRRPGTGSDPGWRAWAQ